MKAIFGVPDFVAITLAIGEPLTVTTEAVPGARFAGKISRIGQVADPHSRVFDAEVTIPNTDHSLRSGMIAALHLANNQRMAIVLAVPLKAVVHPPNDTEGFAVYAAEKRDGRNVAALRKVELGEIAGDRVAVTSGLKAGERVIVRGATLVSDGGEVSIFP